jgi:hypothetical protein
MGAIWMIIIPCLFQTIPIGLNILTLYSYYKLHILKKPPGELILIQLIIFLIREVNATALFVQVNLSGPMAKCEFTFVTSSMTLAASLLYEIWIAFEVFMRVRSAPMGQNYKHRRVLYHLISLLGALCLTLVEALTSECSEEFNILDISKDPSRY